MTSQILITGVTGNVGSQVATLLTEANTTVRGGVHKLPDLRLPVNPRIEWVKLDFSEPTTWPDALAGIKQVFLVRPPSMADVDKNINPFLDMAKALHVEHVVFLSLLGVENNPWVPHRKIEDHLRAIRLTCTSLRASFFMQNLSTTHRTDIRDHDCILIPAGRGRTSFIDARDVAAVGAKALMDTRLRGKAFSLTGAEALDYAQVAQILTRTLGRTIQYRPASAWEFFWHMRKAGHPTGFILVMEALYLVCRLGRAASVTDDLRQVLGRPPSSMEQFAKDHAECWKRP